MFEICETCCCLSCMFQNFNPTELCQLRLYPTLKHSTPTLPVLCIQLVSTLSDNLRYSSLSTFHGWSPHPRSPFKIFSLPSLSKWGQRSFLSIVALAHRTNLSSFTLDKSKNILFGNSNGNSTRFNQPQTLYMLVGRSHQLHYMHHYVDLKSNELLCCCHRCFSHPKQKVMKRSHSLFRDELNDTVHLQNAMLQLIMTNILSL